MRHFIILILLTLSCLAAKAQISGTWLNEEGNAHVKVAEEGNMYQGKLVWAKNEKAKDKMGTQIFIDLKATSKGWEGKVYSLKKNAAYPAKFKLKDEGKSLDMTVKYGFMSYTRTWTRVED
ncbi:MAG: DUF2147 domain-containing protein [Bacteroidia bacterium]|nr:DUF2147 domain-containing protein [Bacteroidia bacterium]